MIIDANNPLELVTWLSRLEARIARLERDIDPVFTPVFKPGDSVSYRPNRSKPFLWGGVVIDRPAGYPKTGAKGDFVYVVRFRDHMVRGCYPWNLEAV